ncbi:MAG: oligosaccharide flippase family protein, partial [Acidimicrobiia bacterium]|nr:oligosaccharide flippase family protein [Acidimicrobiia bacterium]
MSGGRWGAVRSVVLQVTSIVTTAVLARLLTDAEFGLVAITVLVVTMFDLLTSVGLGAALVRRESLDSVAFSTFFWTSLGLGVLAGGLVLLVSTPAAMLAGSEDAAPLVATSALILPFSLTSRIPSSHLIRSLRFRRVAIVNISGSVMHGVVAISLAIAGFGALA